MASTEMASTAQVIQSNDVLSIRTWIDDNVKPILSIKFLSNIGVISVNGNFRIWAFVAPNLLGPAFHVQVKVNLDVKVGNSKR